MTEVYRLVGNFLMGLRCFAQTLLKTRTAQALQPIVFVIIGKLQILKATWSYPGNVQGDTMKKPRVNLPGLILFTLLTGQTYYIYDLHQTMIRKTANHQAESNAFNRQRDPALRLYRKLFRYRDLGPLLRNAAYTKHKIARGRPIYVKLPSRTEVYPFSGNVGARRRITNRS